MIFRRWHHGHSLGAGALAGLAVYSYSPYLLLAAGVCFGIGATLAAIGLYRLGHTLLGAFEEWRRASRAKRQKIEGGPVPVYGRKPGGSYDEIPF